MFTHYRVQGLVLDKEDRGEADRLFTIFTRDFGRLDLFAKAERKIASKLRSGLELFYLSELEFIQGKSHKTITDAILLNKFDFLRKNPERLAAAYRITELLDRFIRDPDHDPIIFDLTRKVFDILNNPKQKIAIIYHYFFWNFISALGYKPELYNCLICQKIISQNNLYFSPKEGGVICGNCRNKAENAKTINPDVVKILRVILAKDWDFLSKLKIEKEYQNALSMVSRSYFNAKITV
ncbi:MAG: DNA repair protein RecO [Candidatus Nealsonbacteria bacterium]|nr:DNA repair protein RecO [Candidatus Nealsonbacteria bacterium]